MSEPQASNSFHWTIEPMADLIKKIDFVLPGCVCTMSKDKDHHKTGFPRNIAHFTWDISILELS